MVWLSEFGWRCVYFQRLIHFGLRKPYQKVFWLAICIGCVWPCLFVRLEVVEGSHLALKLISRSCTSQWKQCLDGFERGKLSWERHTDEDDSFQSMLFGDIDQWKSTVVFAFHLTQRTLTLMLTEHSQSKRLSRGLPKLLNTCLTKVTLRINAIQSQCKIVLLSYCMFLVLLGTIHSVHFILEQNKLY